MNRSGGPTSRNVLIVAGAGAAALAVTAAILFVAFAMLREAVFDGDPPPTCDAPAAVVAWQDTAGPWSRSEIFEITGDTQTVQFDVALGPDGGVLQTGQTVYVVAAGTPLPEYGTETSATTQPFAARTVGSGVDAVNEQVVLDAGRWQLAVRGNAGTATVKWPC